MSEKSSFVGYGCDDVYGTAIRVHDRIKLVIDHTIAMGNDYARPATRAELQLERKRRTELSIQRKETEMKLSAAISDARIAYARHGKDSESYRSRLLIADSVKSELAAVEKALTQFTATSSLINRTRTEVAAAINIRRDAKTIEAITMDGTNTAKLEQVMDRAIERRDEHRELTSAMEHAVNTLTAFEPDEPVVPDLRPSSYIDTLDRQIQDISALAFPLVPAHPPTTRSLPDTPPSASVQTQMPYATTLTGGSRSRLQRSAPMPSPRLSAVRHDISEEEDVSDLESDVDQGTDTSVAPEPAPQHTRRLRL
jgi:uncharacterized protein YbcI